MSSDGSDLRQQIAEALAAAANSQTFHNPGLAWAGFRNMWNGYADAALSVVEPELERLRARVAELEAHPVEWDAQRRRADIAEAEAERLRAEVERHRLAYNAANAMEGVHKRRADRLRTELAHAKGALAGDSEAMTAFMADHTKVVARAREQRDMWQRAAEQAEATIDRAHTLAKGYSASTDGLLSRVGDVFLAALDDTREDPHAGH